MKTLRPLLALLIAALLAAGVWNAPQASPLREFNSDRVSELVIGIPGEDISFGGSLVNHAGAFNVVYGKLMTGLSGDRDQLISQATSNTAGDPETFDTFGSQLAIGDFDHDHNWDLAVGIPGESVNGHPQAGAVQIFYGDGTAISVSRDIIISQDTTGMGGAAEDYDGFGSALAVGDFNADHYDDLAVGVPWEDIGDAIHAGAAHVIFGSSTGLLSAAGVANSEMFYQGLNGLNDVAETDDEFGSQLAAGDFDGDGHDDLAIAAPKEMLLEPSDPLHVWGAGAVNVIYGRWMMGAIAGDDFLNEDSAAFDLCGNAATGEFFGGALAVGKFDDDPFDDLAIGVNQMEAGFHYGGIHIIYGSIDGLNPSGDQCWDGEDMGISVAIDNYFGGNLAACDFNADGKDDLAISMTYDSDGLLSILNHGSIVVVYGGHNGILPGTAHQFMQGQEGLAETREDGDRFGWALQGGNFNGDRYCDLAVGVPLEDLGTPAVEDAGVVQVLFGSAGGITTAGNQLWYQGHNGLQGAIGEGDNFGSALAAVNFSNQWIFLPVIRK